MSKITFYFDMDGTIADLYGVENWLNYLQQENTLPYRQAQLLVDNQKLIEAIKRLKKKDYRFGVISWLSKSGSSKYNARVRSAKIHWLKKNFPNIFDEIHIVKYGTEKIKFKKSDFDFLFDDEEHNRTTWGERAYFPGEMFERLEWVSP